MQINDLDLRESSQTQFSNRNKNVTRLKNVNEFYSINNINNNVQQQNQSPNRNSNKASSYKKAILFSTWSLWSECDKRCKQKRTRNCINRRKCGSVKQTEEKLCEEYL